MRQAQMSEVSCLHRVSFPNNGGGEVMVTIIFITSIVIILRSSWGLVLLPPKTGPTLGISSLQEAMTKVPQMMTLASRGRLFANRILVNIKTATVRSNSARWASGEQATVNGLHRTPEATSVLQSPGDSWPEVPRSNWLEVLLGVAPPLCALSPVPYHLTHLSAAVPVTLGCFHLPYGNPGGVPPGPAFIMWQQTKVYFAPFLFTWQGPITPNLQFQNL